MSKPVSVDFQFSIQQRGRGAKKQMIESDGKSKEPIKTLEPVPRISRYMALAIHFEDLIRKGVITDYADLARLGHVTRARVTQIMNLRLLAPEIQEELLCYETIESRGKTHRLQELQQFASDHDWRSQRRKWQQRA